MGKFSKFIGHAALIVNLKASIARRQQKMISKGGDNGGSIKNRLKSLEE
jgi:hypothetical protein